MTDRGAAPSDRAPACPFVAFDDDRDERADRPDHRHRCYAEVRPAPRAIAHQETYCLSPRFPACPTFQDWARREAAQARGITNRTGVGRVAAADDEPADAVDDAADDGADALAIGAAMAAGAADDADEKAALTVPEPYDDDSSPRGRQQRDWAAPPPWLGRTEDRAAAEGTEPPGAAGLSTSRWLTDVKPGDAGADDDTTFVTVPDPATTPTLVEPVPRPELAGIVGRQRRTARDATERARRERPVVGQARPLARADRERGRDRDHDDLTPAWERPRRFEAYPSIRSRVAFPTGVPPLAVAALALVVAALLLFVLPAFFFSKGTPVASASPTGSSALASASAAPTASPAATPLTYTVKPGDTLTKIANKFKTTQKAILAANPGLKNANLIAVGQVLNIPTPPPPDVIKSSSGTSASPSASTAP
jgi:LysM repeat protein